MHRLGKGIYYGLRIQSPGGIGIEVDIPYGKEMVTVTVDVDCEVLRPNEVPLGDETELLSNGLANPLGCGCFSDFVVGKEDLIILLADATRPIPTPKVIEAMYPAISECDNVRFMVATGTHRAPTSGELDTMFGDYLNEFMDRILVHDSRDDDNLEYVGTTSRGTEVRFNSTVLAADGIIAVNCVKPHYFAGFTGGRKTFLPGVAAYRTIEMNHSHAVKDEAQPLALDGNPVAEDMDEAVRFLDHKNIFSIQTLLAGKHGLSEVFCGDVFESFRAAAERARELYSVPIDGKGNVVLTANIHPMDISLYQSQHAIENSKLALDKNGVMILVSKCWDGIGNTDYLDFLDQIDTQEDVERVRAAGYNLGDHKGIRIMALKSYADLWAVTDLDDEAVLRSKMEPHHGIQEAVDEAIELVRSRGLRPRVFLIPKGGIVVPRLV